MGWLRRSILPPDEIPNGNDPATVPPATVGPPAAAPGDPSGVVVTGSTPPAAPPPRILPSAWAGWPAEWWPPLWSGSSAPLTGTAWACVDLNASVLASMPPYLVNEPPSGLDSSWIVNPDPDLYASWDEFAKALFWDFQLGEAFVLCTARYANGWPARFHVVPPGYVDVELDGGLRRYRIGGDAPGDDLLHIRYTSRIDQPRGVGPLAAAGQSVLASRMLAEYAASFAASGGLPTSILTHPQELDPEQSAKLQAQWVTARQSHIGEPAVLSGGIEWKAVQTNPKDMALVDLAKFEDSRIAIAFGVPPFLVGLPSGGDSMTYANVSSIFDYHWRAGLRPKASSVMAALSGFLLPRGVQLEVNRDAYVRPDLKTRAETYAILAGLQDPQGNPAMTIDEIRAAERLDDRLPQGALRG